MGRYNEWIGQEAPEGSWRKGWWGEEVTLFEGELSIDFQEMSSVLLLKSRNYGHLHNAPDHVEWWACLSADGLGLPGLWDSFFGVECLRSSPIWVLMTLSSCLSLSLCWRLILYLNTGIFLSICLTYSVAEATNCKQADVDFRGHEEIYSESGGVMDYEEDRGRPKR